MKQVTLKLAVAQTAVAAGDALPAEQAIGKLAASLETSPSNFTVGDKQKVRGYVVYPVCSVEALNSVQVTPIKLHAQFAAAAKKVGFSDGAKPGQFMLDVAEGKLLVRYAPLAGCFDVFVEKK